MRLLGDEYVKSEFRLHRDAENPLHIVRRPFETAGERLRWGVGTDISQIGFLTEWQLYAQKLEGESWVGERMDPAVLDKMSGSSSGFERTGNCD